VLVVGVLDAGRALGVGRHPRAERLLPLAGPLEADLVDVLVLPLLRAERGAVVVDPADAPAGLGGQVGRVVDAVNSAGDNIGTSSGGTSRVGGRGGNGRGAVADGSSIPFVSVRPTGLPEQYLYRLLPAFNQAGSVLAHLPNHAA
jgi:hypothetical protein